MKTEEMQHIIIRYAVVEKDGSITATFPTRAEGETMQQWREAKGRAGESALPTPTVEQVRYDRRTGKACLHAGLFDINSREIRVATVAEIREARTAVMGEISVDGRHWRLMDSDTTGESLPMVPVE